MLLKWLFNSTVDPLHSFSQKQSGQGFENVNHLISCPAQNPSKLSCQTWFWLLAPSPASYPSSSSETQIRQSSLLPQTIFFFLSRMLSPWFSPLFHACLCKKALPDYSIGEKKHIWVSISCLCWISFTVLIDVCNCILYLFNVWIPAG